MSNFALKQLLVLLVLVAIPCVSAATLHGVVYDLELSRAQGTIVEVNSSPQQVVVAADGSFVFQLAAGAYSIFARHRTFGVANDTLVVPAEGVFVRDLILFPIGPDDSLAVEALPDVPDDVAGPGSVSWWLVTVVLVGCAILVIANFGRVKRAMHWLFLVVAGIVAAVILTRKFKGVAPADDELVQLVSFVRREGGRATQKDIRKALFPLSEAKISLMITQLEQEGKLEKIKRGRANIIILK